VADQAIWTSRLIGLRLEMARSDPIPTDHASGRTPRPEPAFGVPVAVSASLAHAAACRIVSQASGDVDAAARRLLASAPQHGIDFGLAFATLEPPAPGHPGVVEGDPDNNVLPDAKPDARSDTRPRKTAKPTSPNRVRQACLPVLGPGRTAMVFVSEPVIGVPEDPVVSRRERAACINAALQSLATTQPDRVKIAQALPEVDEPWFEAALDEAGFVPVGTLSYLRQEPAALMRGKKTPPPPLPADVSIRWLSQVSPGESDAQLLAALDASYEDTLDCPELCGLRETRDILASHKSTGKFDPSLWLMVYLRERALGCVLLSRCVEQRTIELVYLGLGKGLRGMGLGRSLLTFAIATARQQTPSWSISCAVDERNVPAIRLYTSMGFVAFARRLARVKPI
jgi:ribosomal protein S18 acetylase RimI-like enzyme